MFSFNSNNPAVCGHRGAPAVARENTVESFGKARDLGATWLEFDVRPTADEQLIVHHDPTTAEGHHVASTRADALPEYIPTLRKIVENFGDLVLDVELKTDETDLDADAYVALAAAELANLASVHTSTSLLVTSFDGEVLQKFAATCPAISTGFLYYLDAAAYSAGGRDAANQNALDHAQAAGHQAVVPHHKLVTADLVDRAHAQGLGVATWTVNTAADVRRCAEAGVDVVIGDDPRVIVDALRGRS